MKIFKETTAATLQQLGWPSVGKGAVDNLRSSQHAPLYALIIGIDHYKSKKINDLHGAASDADAMDEYLRAELHVPADQIVNLRDEHATRSRIIRELQAMRTRKGIKRSDPILIFFAGHGASAPAPEDWATASDRISTIVTHDSLVTDCTGRVVCPIPDRTIEALLHNLAETPAGDDRGDNITVIFDCCHSGSGTRDVRRKASRLERGFDLDVDLIPANLDKVIWKTVPKARGTSATAGFTKCGCRSHVLLAACRETENAFEERGRGAFTRALLDTLKTVATDSITYKDLMQRLPVIPGQTPQCEGYNTNRLLFDALAPSKARVIYEVVEKDSRYVMNAGSAHGVAVGARFYIHPSREFSSDASPLTVMVATIVHAFSAELSGKLPTGATITFPSSYFACPVSAGYAQPLRLHISDWETRIPVMKKLANELSARQDPLSPPVLLCEEGPATLGIRLRGSYIEYLVYDPLVVSLGLSSLYYTTKAETTCIQPVLRSASRFFGNLHRSPLLSQLSGNVHVRIHEIRQDMHGELDMDLRPPFRTYGDNVLRSGTANVKADGKTIYGMSLQNSLRVPLHVWVFFFDCSDLSVNYYQPPASGRNGEASLPPSSTLSIGYGAGGALPFKYFLRPDQELDIGFIKVFICTEPVDFSHVMQQSAFDDSSARGTGWGAERRPKHAWDTILIPVVQRRGLS
ncbi:hypothetical protein PENSPDRAFT_692662 [Peniophora sp. CONT]|nr:hypothetical protein PENSPDRAFT_692662 [Peniophora sp. CONT]